MTNDERDQLKDLVDRARRAKLDHKRLCLYCDKPFAAARHAGTRQKFCCDLHRKSYWQRTTTAGRTQQAAYKRRRRAELRAQTQLPVAA